MKRYTYLIVGAGIAGIKAAEAIRTVDRSGSILLLSAEDRLPYKRTKIDKHLHCGFAGDQFILKPPTWYKALKIDVELRSPVVDLLCGPKTVITEAGRSYSYEKLLLCTGAEPILPECLLDRPQLFSCVRSINQAESVVKLLAAASHVTVLGGGVQGVEMADQCLQAGKKTTLLHHGLHLMDKYFPTAYGRDVAAAFLQAGAKIYVGRSLLGLEKASSRKLSVDLGGRSFQTDLLLVSIGAKPATCLAKRAGLKIDNGIVINDRFETSRGSIYAAGDNARMENGYATSLWHAAEYQGTLAGKSMAGSPEVFEPKSFRLKCEVLGAYYFSLNFAQSRHLKPYSFTAGSIRQTWFVEGDQVRGVVMKNDKERAGIYEKAIFEGWPMGRILETLG